MNRRKSAYLIYFIGMGVFMSLFSIFYIYTPEERTVGFILLCIFICFFGSWLAAKNFIKSVDKQIEGNSSIELDLMPQERIEAEAVAGYKHHGGKLIITNQRLCYIRVIFRSSKLIIDQPANHISNVELSGKTSITVHMTESISYRFKVENAQELYATIRLKYCSAR